MTNVKEILTRVRNRIAPIAVGLTTMSACGTQTTDVADKPIVTTRDSVISATDFYQDMKKFIQKQLDEKKIFLSEAYEQKEAYLLIPNGKESLEVCYYPENENFSFNDGKNGTFYLDKTGVSFLKYDEQGAETQVYVENKSAKDKIYQWSKVVQNYARNGATLDASSILSQGQGR